MAKKRIKKQLKPDILDMDDQEFGAYLLTLLMMEVAPLLDPETAYPVIYEFLTAEIVNEEDAVKYGRLIASSAMPMSSGLH